jgi:hypothetical protein
VSPGIVIDALVGMFDMFNRKVYKKAKCRKIPTVKIAKCFWQVLEPLRFW